MWIFGQMSFLWTILISDQLLAFLVFPVELFSVKMRWNKNERQSAEASLLKRKATFKKQYIKVVSFSTSLTVVMKL